VATSMGKYYDLPVFGLGGCTDSKLLDQQCGFESTLSLVSALMNGANLVHDLGFMESGLQGSLQLVTLADDYLGFLRAATARVLVNDETLALDVIRELGPDGDYLSHDHTYRHFRQPYYSDLADKNPHSVWMERGGRSMEARAAEKVDRLLSSHRVEPLPGDVQKEIKRIVAREQVWIDSQR
jgi:trimethylamine--corrinoid protein Co-methyltransferase